VPTRLFSSAEIIAECDPALYLGEDAQRVRDEIWTRINGSKTRTATCDPIDESLDNRRAAGAGQRRRFRGGADSSPEVAGGYRELICL